MMLRKAFKFSDNIKVADFLNLTGARIRTWGVTEGEITVWVKEKEIAAKWDKIAAKRKLNGKALNDWTEDDKKS